MPRSFIPRPIHQQKKIGLPEAENALRNKKRRRNPSRYADAFVKAHNAQNLNNPENQLLAFTDNCDDRARSERAYRACDTQLRRSRKKTAEGRACSGNHSGDIQDLPTGRTGDDEHVEAVNQCVQSEPVRFQSSSPQNTGTYPTEQNLRAKRIALSPRGSRAAPVVQYCQPEQWSSDHVLMSAADVPSISGSASAVVPDLNVADAVVIDPIAAVPARSTTRKRQLRRAPGMDGSSVGVRQSAKQSRILELTQEINRLKDTADWNILLSCMCSCVRKGSC